MNIDYFTRFGQHLENALTTYDSDAEHDESDLLHWLMDASANAKGVEAFCTWSNLLVMYLEKESKEYHPNALRTQLVQEYFDYLLTVSGPDFIDHTIKFNFKQLLNTLHANPVHCDALGSLTAKGWSPAALLTHFSNHIPDYKAEDLSYNRIFILKDSNMWLFHKTCIAMLSNSNSVTPAQDPIFSSLWSAYTIEQQPNHYDYAKSLRDILSLAPEDLAIGLASVREQKYLKEEYLAAFFPLPINRIVEDNQKLRALDCLIALILDEPVGVKGLTHPLVHKHHPDLGQLLDLHLSIFSDVDSNNTFSNSIAEPFMNLFSCNAASQSRIQLDSTFCIES